MDDITVSVVRSFRVVETCGTEPAGGDFLAKISGLRKEVPEFRRRVHTTGEAARTAYNGDRLVHLARHNEPKQVTAFDIIDSKQEL